MKNSHIAFWIAIAGAVFFFYNIHEIHGIEEEAAVWQSNVQANDNPGASSYIKAFFDGATLGAFSNGDIFAEAHNQEKMSAELETTRKILLKRYQNAVSYRNWGLLFGVAALAVGFYLKKKAV